MPFYLRITRLHPRPDVVLAWATDSRPEEQFALVEDVVGATYVDEQGVLAAANALDSLFQLMALLPANVQREVNIIELSADGVAYVRFSPAPNTSPNLLSNSGVRLPPKQLKISCPVLSPPQPIKANPILSLGFEFQSSDLFVVLIQYANGQFNCCYAGDDDIPEDAPVPLFVDNLQTSVHLQLDAIDPPTEGTMDYYVKKLDWASGKGVLGGHDLAFVESDTPQDTEFMALNTNALSLMCFEPRTNADPLELIKCHFELLKAEIFSFRLRDEYVCFKYHMPFPSQTVQYKTNLFWVPKIVSTNGQRFFGFMTQTFDESRTCVSFVPQVTFGCSLMDAHGLLGQLLTATADNPHKGTLVAVRRYGESLFGQNLEKFACSNALSFVCLMLYYVHIATVSSKQSLGIALRHTFREVFNSLSPLEHRVIRGVLGGHSEAMLKHTDRLEQSDGIHRYPYEGPQRVLIEYRLFNYVTSPGGVDVVDVSHLVPTSRTAIVPPTDEELDILEGEDVSSTDDL